MGRGLVLVDIQNDYFSGGAMALRGMESAADNTVRILQHFRENEDPVFHVQHLSVRHGATFFIPETPGSLIYDSVKPQDSESVIQKNYPSAFQDTTLAEQLNAAGVKELVFCGAMSHMCIDTTVRAAFGLGYKSVVISDACATCDLEFQGRIVSAGDVHAAFMAALGMVFARIENTKEFLAG